MNLLYVSRMAVWNHYEVFGSNKPSGSMQKMGPGSHLVSHNSYNDVFFLVSLKSTEANPAVGSSSSCSCQLCLCPSSGTSTSSVVSGFSPILAEGFLPPPHLPLAAPCHLNFHPQSSWELLQHCIFCHLKPYTHTKYYCVYFPWIGQFLVKIRKKVTSNSSIATHN